MKRSFDFNTSLSRNLNFLTAFYDFYAVLNFFDIFGMIDGFCIFLVENMIPMGNTNKRLKII
jgi:hypothetical protein